MSTDPSSMEAYCDITPGRTIHVMSQGLMSPGGDPPWQDITYKGMILHTQRGHTVTVVVEDFAAILLFSRID